MRLASSRAKALAGPLALAAVAVAALILNRAHPLWEFGQPGPGLLPTIAAVLLLVASLASIWSARSGDGESVAIGRVAGYALGLILLVPVTAVIGMLPALALFVAVVLWLIEGLRPVHAIAIAVGSALGCWLLFERLLSVPLPKPMFW